jgi:hypothetical protein
MFYSPPAVSAARKNIKLLSSADKLAIKKIKNEKYKTVLGKQEKQLNHYLSTYTDPDYLPQSITKEYEFPKYFYYTVNKRDGEVVQKRTRVDSKTFKNFMKNPEKRRQAKEQGLYNITDKPININFDIPAPTPKFKKPKSINDILGNVNFGDTSNQKKIYGRDRRYEDTGPSIIQYSEKLSPATSSLKNKFKIQVIKDALDRAIIKKANSTMEQAYIIDKNFKKQYKTAMQNRDFKIAMDMVYRTKKDIEHDIPLKIKELDDERKDINNKLKNTEDPKKIRDMNTRKKEISRFIKLEKTSMDNAIKKLPQLLKNLEFERKLFYNRGEATIEIPENAHKMTISDLLKIGLTKSQIASIKGKGIKYLDDDYDSE